MDRRKKYKIIEEDLVNNLVSFLDEIQFDAAKENNKESMHIVNFCSWAISELLNSYDGFLKYDNRKSNKDTTGKKSRDEYIEETFMDWNFPDMTEEDYEKLVDQFDAFLKGWEREYYKKPQKKVKKKKQTFKPHLEDVAEYMTLDEIKEMLLDDPELTDNERFDLYYEEHCRVQKAKERKKQEKKAQPLDKVLKDLDIKPSNWKEGDDKKN